MKVTKTTAALSAAAMLVAGQAALANMDGAKKVDQSNATVNESSSAMSGPATDNVGEEQDLEDLGTTSGATTTGTQNTGTQQPMAKDQSMAKQQTGASAQKMTDYLVIDFQKGQAQLTPDQQQKLRTLIENSRAAGQIDTVHVAVWSDQAFPAQQQAELPEAAKNLAQSRSEQLQNFFEKQLKVDQVETYSMAEKSNWMARTFNTQEAELKSVFSQQGGAPIKNEDFRIIKQQGGAGKAVVLIERPEQAQQKNQQGMQNKEQMGTQSGATTGAVNSDPSADLNRDTEMREHEEIEASGTQSGSTVEGQKSEDSSY